MDGYAGAGGAEREEEEEERRGRRSFLALPALVVDVGSGMLAAGFAGCDAPRDAFPLVDDWHLLLGNTAGMDQKDSSIVVVVAVAYARLVLLVSLLALCSSLSLSGPDGRHHGRYEPEGHVRSWVGLTGDAVPRAVFSRLVVGPRCSAIMAGMDENDSYAVHPCSWCRGRFPRSSLFRNSFVACQHGESMSLLHRSCRSRTSSVAPCI